jgi:hypothetical protein
MQNLSSPNFIRVNPVNVLWQIEAMEKLDFSGAIASSTNNKWIQLWLASGAGHYFWANYNSTGVDPVQAGTGHAVVVGIGDADTVIAESFKTSINATAGFTAVRSGTVVTVTRTIGTGVGEVTDPTTNFQSSNLTMTQVRRGKDFNLGLLKGDVDPKFSPSNLTVHAHQFGKTPLLTLNQGFDKIEVSTKLLETDNAKLKAMHKLYGGSVIGGSSEVFGAGTFVLGKNILIDAARLIFKPVNAVDNSGNMQIALAIPVPGSLIFSGENPNELEVSWMGFADLLMNSKINVISFGDISQSGLTA